MKYDIHWLAEGANFRVVAMYGGQWFSLSRDYHVPSSKLSTQTTIELARPSVTTIRSEKSQHFIKLRTYFSTTNCYVFNFHI
jgi:hypothetical protein